MLNEWIDFFTVIRTKSGSQDSIKGKTEYFSWEPDHEYGIYDDNFPETYFKKGTFR